MHSLKRFHPGIRCSHRFAILLFALASGVLLAASFGYWQGSGGLATGLIVMFVIALAWGAKLIWWQAAQGNTLAARGSTPGTATGLGSIGKVRLLEKPHSGENYLTKEMVHQVGRKHAAKLRIIALLFGAVFPLVLGILVMVIKLPTPALTIAFVSLITGLFVERWLFFAEAKHAVSLYY